jgi:hypothetical protein
MSTLTKTLLAVLATTLIGGAAYVAAAPADRNTTPSAPATADVRGPCDEAEHAADPRCAAPQDKPNHVENRDQSKAEDSQAARDDNQAEDAGDDNQGEVEHHGNPAPGSPNSGQGNAGDRGEAGNTQDNSGSGSGDSGQSGSGELGSGPTGSGDSGSGGSGGD